MEATPKILLQLDCDSLSSTFDAVVAIDSGVNHLLQYQNVTPENVEPLVHGAMFTRGGEKIKSTAIFVGGSDVSVAESVLAKVCSTFFGPVRVSVMFDANGCNTTASAAVLSAARHVDLANSKALVLGGTGPVGQRVARLLAKSGCQVLVGSRDRARSQKAVHHIGEHVSHELLSPVATSQPDQLLAALEGVNVVIACGAAGIQLLDETTFKSHQQIRVAIDLNAVPPAGIGGIEVTDKAKDCNGTIVYGAIGVGGLKMKIHRTAVAKLFTASDLLLDANELYAIGQQIESQ